VVYETRTGLYLPKRGNLRIKNSNFGGTGSGITYSDRNTIITRDNYHLVIKSDVRRWADSGILATINNTIVLNCSKYVPSYHHLPPARFPSRTRQPAGACRRPGNYYC